MIKDFFKAVGQLPDRRFRGVLLTGVLGALVVLAAVWAGIFYLLAPFLDVSGAVPSWLGGDYLTGLLETIVGLLLGVGVWFLFPPAVLAITGLFLDAVAEAVEAKHYPNLGAVRVIPMWETVVEALKFALVALALNLFALLFIFTGPLYLVIYYTLNGYLLGREYFDLVASRRHAPTEAIQLRRKHIFSIWLAGVGFTALMNVPVLNLIIPVLAVAYMVHYAVRVGVSSQILVSSGQTSEQ